MARRRPPHRLTSAERDALPPSMFALPRERKYPIPDRYHAGLALGRGRHASPRQAAEIRRNVHAAFPSTRVRGEFVATPADWTPWLVGAAALVGLYVVTRPTAPLSFS